MRQREGGGGFRLSTGTPRLDPTKMSSLTSSSPTSSKPAPVWAFHGMLSMNKRLLVFLAIILACLMILLRPHQTQAVVSQLSGNLDTSSSKLQDWIPRSSKFFGATQSKKETVVHHIPKLMAKAQAKFKTMITGQSKTLAEAVKEYKRRYGRNPPKGFDEWFEFAQENGVKIIDEYDQLVRDLEPFWSMSGKELRRRAIQVLGRVVFEGGRLKQKTPFAPSRLAICRLSTWYD
jgi:hypothetical protein